MMNQEQLTAWARANLIEAEADLAYRTATGQEPPAKE